MRLFFKKWGELVNPFGAIFLIVGRVGEKVGRFGVGRFASGAIWCGAICPASQLNYDGHTNSFKIMKPITPQNK